MITNDELNEILQKKEPYDLEQIKVIVKYIFDKTKKDISNQPINNPTDVGNYIMMQSMYQTAKQFYLNGK